MEEYVESAEGKGSRITLRPSKNLFCDHEAIPEEAADYAKVVLPPGYRFLPTDKELILRYLKPAMEGCQVSPSNHIESVDVYQLTPDKLAENYHHFGEEEWYFFTPRCRKYPQGSRPSRSAGNGYWKATGADTPVQLDGGTTIGFKKSLVFYLGKAPDGVKTDWVMHEYTTKTTLTAPERKLDKNNDDMLLDRCVLCRIYKKNEKATENEEKVPRKRAKKRKRAADKPSKGEELDEMAGNAPMLQPEQSPPLIQLPEVQHEASMQWDLPPFEDIPTLVGDPMQFNPSREKDIALHCDEFVGASHANNDLYENGQQNVLDCDPISWCFPEPHEFLIDPCSTTLDPFAGEYNGMQYPPFSPNFQYMDVRSSHDQLPVGNAAPPNVNYPMKTEGANVNYLQTDLELEALRMRQELERLKMTSDLDKNRLSNEFSIDRSDSGDYFQTSRRMISKPASRRS